MSNQDVELKGTLNVDEILANYERVLQKDAEVRATVERPFNIRFTGAGSGGGRAAQGGPDEFSDLADARNRASGRLGDIQEQLENTPRSAERAGLYAAGFRTARDLHDVQEQYDASIPTSASRGQRAIADIQEQADRENARRTQREGMRMAGVMDAANREYDQRDLRQYQHRQRREAVERYGVTVDEDASEVELREAEQLARENKAQISADNKRFEGLLNKAQKDGRDFTRQEEKAEEEATNRLRNFAGAAAYGVARAATQYLNAEAQEVATGNSNPQGASGGFGGAAGGIVGAGIGTLVGGPFGPLVGARIGEQFGSAAGELTSAFSLAQNNVAKEAFPYAFAHGQDPTQFFDSQAQRNPFSLSGMDNRFMANEHGFGRARKMKSCGSSVCTMGQTRRARRRRRGSRRTWDATPPVRGSTKVRASCNRRPKTLPSTRLMSGNSRRGRRSL